MKSASMLAALAGAVLALSSCAAVQTSQTPSPSSEASTTPSTAPSPEASPTADTSPSPIAASPSPARLIITSVPFHIGEVGVTYGTVTLKASGGVKPYKWSISSGALPPGIAVSSGGSATGKPAAAGTFSFVIRVADSAGAAAGVSRSIFVFRQIAFTKNTATCTATFDTCTTTLNYSGGASKTTPKLKVTLTATDPPLPQGSTFTVKAGVVTIFIGYQCNAFSTVVTLVLIDQNPCTTGYKCSSAPATVYISKTYSC